MLFWEREEEEEIGVHFYLNIKRNLMQYSSTYKTSQQLLAEEKMLLPCYVMNQCRIAALSSTTPKSTFSATKSSLLRILVTCSE